MDCIDDDRIVVRLHPDKTVSIGEDQIPLANLRRTAREMLRYYDRPSVWLLADSGTEMQDVAFMVDAIHQSSAAVRTLLITEREERELRSPESPENDFKSIATVDPDKFPNPPSICIMPPFPKFAVR
jgi:hypothetical protein